MTTDAEGNWNDQVNFTLSTSTTNNVSAWTARADFDGDTGRAPSESNQVRFFVGD